MHFLPLPLQRRSDQQSNRTSSGLHRDDHWSRLTQLCHDSEDPLGLMEINLDMQSYAKSEAEIKQVCAKCLEQANFFQIG